MEKVSVFLGLATPADFPIDVYDEVGHRMGNLSGKNRDHLREFLGGWQAVAYRSIACAKYDSDFTELMRLYGANPSFEQQYLQGQYLFNFFINGLSILESICYALFAIGSLVKPSSFLIATSEERKRISPENTEKCFRQVFGLEPITTLLTGLVINSQEFQDWKIIRNVLIHRVIPSRLVSLSTTNTKVPDIWRVEIASGLTLDLDMNTTISKRLWLNNQLILLITEINAFTQKELI